MEHEMHEVYFATFLHGRFSELEHRLRSEARIWASVYQERQVFPEPAVAPVARDSTIYTHDASDFERGSNQWRTYFASALGNAICETLEWHDYARVSTEFEAHTQRYSWGTLDAAVAHVAPNSLDAAKRRLTSLMQFWPALSTLRYIDLEPAQPLPLGDLIQSHYKQFLAMYLDKPRGDPRADLESALQNAERASVAQVEESVIESLHRLSHTDTRIRHPQALQERSRLKAMVGDLEPGEYANLTGLHVPALKSALYLFDDAVGRGQP
jgi:hypothetical protein